MRSRYRKNKQKRKAPAKRRPQVALEKLDSRLLLNATQEWTQGFDLNQLTTDTPDAQQLLDDLNHIFHPHKHTDGFADPFYSDPSTWDLSAIFGESTTLNHSQLHELVDTVFGDDHIHDDISAGNQPHNHGKDCGCAGCACSSSEAYASTESESIEMQLSGDDFMTAGSPKLLYLDFDGAQVSGRSNDSWLYSYNATVPEFSLARYGWGGREAEAIDYMVEFIKEDYAPYNIEVVTERPTADQYTTIFVGGNNDWFQANSGVIGVASYDVGNKRDSNYGFAFTDEMSVYFNSSAGSLFKFSEFAANLISHEAAHTFGANHIDDISAIMNPFLPLSPRTSMFGSNNVYGSGMQQDTQSLLGNNLGYANGSDDYGDNTASAHQVSTNSSIDGILERRDDIDTFEFTATSSGSLTIDIDTHSFTNLNSFMRVLENGSQIAENDNDSDSKDSSISFTTVAGQKYTIEVSSLNNLSSGSYTLNIGNALDFEPDQQIDVTADATTLEPNPFGNQVIHSNLSSSSEIDIYKFALDVSGTMSIDIDGAQTGIYSALYDANGDLLEWNVDNSELQSASFGQQATTWQTYYLVVGSIDENASGNYTLSLDSSNVISSNLTVDVTGHGSRLGSISQADSDYYRFVSPHNTTGSLDLGLDITGNWDGVLSLYDINGDLVARSDFNGISGSESILASNIIAGQTYYARIGSEDLKSVGNYVLDVNFSMPQQSGDIQITDSIGNSSDRVMNFGDITINTNKSAVVTISNNGLLDLHVTELIATAGFSINTTSLASTSSDDIIITPGSNLPVILSFTPTQLGPMNGLIKIASNDPDQPVSYIALSSNVLEAQPDIDIHVGQGSFDNNQLTIGDLIRGETFTQTITVTNTGHANLTLDQIDVSSNLILVNPQSETLTPGQSHDLTLEILATQRGLFSGDLTISSNDPDTPTQTIDIQANVLGGELDINTETIDLGSVIVGNAKEKKITLTNSGDADLDINSITANGGFYVTPSLNSGLDNLSLAAGESIDLSIGLNPDDIGLAEGMLKITTNDIESPYTEIPLQAETLAGVLQITELDGNNDGQIDLDRQEVHTQTQFDAWELTNNGNMPITIHLVLSNDNDFHLASYDQIYIPSGASYTVQVDFNTALAREVTDKLILTSNDLNQTSAELDLSADGYATIGKGQNYQFTDQSGDQVKISLSGDATAEVTLGSDLQPDIQSITLLTGDENANLNINVNGQGRTRLGEIRGSDDLNSISASKVELVGDGILLEGQLNRLKLGHVLSNADIQFSNNDPVNIKLGHVVGNNTLDIQAPINSFSASNFVGGQLSSPSIENLKINGRLDADINVTESNLNKLIVKNDSVLGDINVEGSLNTLKISHGNLMGAVTVENNIDRLLVNDGTISSTIQSQNSIGKIRAMNINHAEINAINSIDKIRVDNDMIDSNIVIGYDSLNQQQDSSNASAQINATLNSLRVNGSFGSSNIAVGIAPDDQGNFIKGSANTASGFIGDILLKNVDANNDADPFGLIAQTNIEKLKIDRDLISSNYNLDDFFVTTLNLNLNQ